MSQWGLQFSPLLPFVVSDGTPHFYLSIATYSILCLVVACLCNLLGSIRDDCEQNTGRCLCKDGVEGELMLIFVLRVIRLHQYTSNVM